MKIVSVNIKVDRKARKIILNFCQDLEFCLLPSNTKTQVINFDSQRWMCFLGSCVLTMGCPNTCISKVIERHWARPSLDKRHLHVFPLGFHLRNDRGVYLNTRCKGWDMDAKNGIPVIYIIYRLHCCPPQHRQKHTRSEMRSTGGSQEHAGPKSEDQPFHPSNSHLSTCPVSRATQYTKATAHRWTAKTREHHLEKAPSTTLSQPFHPRKEKKLH